MAKGKGKRTTGRKPPKTPAATPAAAVPPFVPLKPPPGGVAVRMYRAGLGDCFLLAFHPASGKADADPDAEPAYVLIDCGIHSRQEAGPARLKRVMDDIMAVTGGKLSVVVATHEHADHMSGFHQKDGPFRDRLAKITQLWVAWTEREGDEIADKLRARRGVTRAAIAKAADKLQKSGLAGRGNELLGLGDFELVPEALGAAAAAAAEDEKKPNINEIAQEFLRRESEGVKHCYPGHVLEVPGVKGVRAYVLGPPRDEEQLKKDLPTGGDHGVNRETYLSGRPDLAALRMAPALGMADDIDPDYRFPFERNLRRRLPGLTITDEEMASEMTDAPPEPAQFWENHYLEPTEQWRRIDADWLGGAEQLALNLESDTNNTSLVLAFELGKPGEGKVLLFVGDAQVGNWLSWRDVKLKHAGVTLTADDLLSRTVLYKVGHHGSHNATVKRVSATDASPYGLELMPSAMIALIPVDRDAAQKPKPWAMPHQPLYEKLLNKAGGRVLRSDGLGPWWPKPPKQKGPNGDKSEPVPGLPGVEWCEAAEKFTDGRTCPLYYELQFRPEP